MSTLIVPAFSTASPTFTTGIVAGSATMALLNTTATTVNAFGAATKIVMGGANVTGTTTNSQLYLPLAITSGTGAYLYSTSIISGKLLDLNIYSLVDLSNATALNIGITGSAVDVPGKVYGARISNTYGSAEENIALELTASGTATNTALKITAGKAIFGTNGFGISKIISSSVNLNFGSTAAGAVSDLTISLTGAALGDTVILGVPHGSVPAAGSFSAWVSATNVVTVRFANNALVTAYDPASGTFRVTIIQ